MVLNARTHETDALGAIQQLLSIDSHVPIILHSAYSSYKENFLSWLADAYVEKSFDLSELKRNIDELLSRSQHAMR